MGAGSNNKATVGIIANPLSARDIRRLISQASGLQIADRVSMIQRAITGLSAVGIEDVFIMPDRAGLSSQLSSALDNQRIMCKSDIAKTTFLDMPVSGSVIDTENAAMILVDQGVDAIIVLGGDGTCRAVAERVTDIPITCLSTGTNNAFPVNVEPTLAGMATGLVARNLVNRDDCCNRNKTLRLYINGRKHISALVDIVVTNSMWNGSLALWKPSHIEKVYVTFASPMAVGISSIASQLNAVSRNDEFGLYLEVDNRAKKNMTVMAPIVPGLVEQIGIKGSKKIYPDVEISLSVNGRSIAIDGERCVEVDDADDLYIKLDLNGPITIDVEKTMYLSSKHGVLNNFDVKQIH